MVIESRYVVAGLLLLVLNSGQVVAADPRVVVLTQQACQFIESENGLDRGYKSFSAEDCLTINRATSEQRLQQAKVLQLRPGKHLFRVTNEDVPYELGFWLRGHGVLGYATLPSISGGGLTTGKTQDYLIELKPGSYIYSCPLNPTPDYRLIVSE
ncbi:hypothetical protein [Amphritea sp. HPY]|uniref:hypothetical protein n=1 Tax=Amphritea sp. HPY TaxID=3421652 RepID=UPI003D7C92F9